VTRCPGGYLLCGIPCGCEGRNRSHYPRYDDRRRLTCPYCRHAIPDHDGYGRCCATVECDCKIGADE
jgi:hypothetical protein